MRAKYVVYCMYNLEIRFSLLGDSAMIIGISKFIHDKYITRTEVHVPLLKDVGHCLLSCGCGVLVPLELFQRITLDNLSNELSGLTRICLYAETVLVSDGFSGNLC